MTISDECDVAFRSDIAPTVSNESDKMAAAAKKGEQRRALGCTLGHQGYIWRGDVGRWGRTR